MSRRASGLWQDVRSAMRGAEHDYTALPLPRSIVLLAIPMVLEMCMESLFSIVDIFWVARLGPATVAAAGVTEVMLTLVYALALGISMATTAMVARRIGEQDADGAARSAVQAIALGFVVSLFFSISGAVYAPELLLLMGAEPEVAAAGSVYTRLILGSSVSVFMLYLMNAIFRGAGDPAIAMRVLWAANLLNMVLDPLLIYGIGPFPEMGVAGAGVATAIGRSFGVALQLAHFFRASGRIKIQRRHLALDMEILKRLARVSTTGALQFVIAHASWIGLVRIMAVSGSAALAGYTIAIRIVIFSILPSWGFSNAAATLVGQNLGAGSPERAEKAVWLTGFYNMLFLGVLGIVFIAVPEPLVRVFITDPAAVRYGADCLRTVSYGYLFYAYGMVMVQAFNGAGDTTTPTYINLGCYWAFQLPLAWLLALPLGWGANGAFWAIPAAECFLTAVAVLAFRRGRWKTQRI